MRIRFDRGTIVFDNPEPGLDPAQLLGAAYDSELAAWRLPAERLCDVRGRLAAKRVRVADHVGQPAALNPTWTLPELRWYQRKAIDAWRDSGDRGVIVLPTGAGKTIAAISAIAALGVATLILVPTRILLDQWIRAIEACWPHPVGRLGDGDHHIAPITVSTYASAITSAPRMGDRFGLVIVDEAHHVGAWCPREVLEMLVAPARLGLTATPPDPQPTATQSVTPHSALGTHVGPVVYSISQQELAGNALAPFTLETVPIKLTDEERAHYQTFRSTFSAVYAKLARQTPGMQWREFVRRAQRTDDGRDALSAWRSSRALLAYPEGKRAELRKLLAAHEGDRILVFTADNATAYAIARELLVMPITCDIGRSERAHMLDRFRSGDSSVLVSAQVLDEGFDVPDAEVAILVGGTASARRQVQRVGRVLRPRPGKHARVYELVVEASSEVRQVAARHGQRPHQLAVWTAAPIPANATKERRSRWAEAALGIAARREVLS
jgi:superfamily II DNA or RNA helicase